MFRPTLLTLALVALCGNAPALAQSTTPARATKPDATTEAQLAAARADLERAARRVAELSRQLGHGDAPVRIERRVVRKPVLGVLLAPDGAGVRIAGVTPDGAAAAAGLRSGDRVTRIDGQPILGSSGELRVDNARRLLADLDTGKPVSLDYVRDGRPANARITPRLDDQVFVFRGPGDGPMAIERLPPPGVAPRIRSEVFRIGPQGECRGGDCRLPALAEAFRWNGLNLASVDQALGRYFGTDRGVLVLSTGDLAGLQPGDVIRTVDGTAVGSPREAMDVLRGKPADALVLVEYLRDRKSASTRIKVPKAMPLRLPPPAPPAPPAPPKAPPAPPPPPAPPLGGSDARQVRTVRLAFAPPPAPMPPPISDSVIVQVD